MKNISLSTLIVSHLIFLVISPIALQFSFAGILGLGLVEGGGWLETRAWGMFISSLLFPVVTIAVIISTWILYTKKSYTKAILISLLPLINIVFFYSLYYWDPLGLSTYDATPKLTAREAYETYLNLDLPSTISNLRSEYQDLFPVSPNWVHLTYQADPTYFEMLRNHNKFIRRNEFNEQIHQVDCTSRQFPSDILYWGEKDIDLTDRICFMGTFFPYIHYLVYDPATGHVDHFVEGML